MSFKDLNWVKITGNAGVAFCSSVLAVGAFTQTINWQILGAGVALGIAQGLLAMFQEMQSQSGTSAKMPRKQPYVTKSKMPRKQPWATKAIMFYTTL